MDTSRVGISRLSLPPDDLPAGIRTITERIARELHAADPEEIGRSAMTVEHLTKWGGPTPDMPRLVIGCVWCDFRVGSFAMVDILLHREVGW